MQHSSSDIIATPFGSTYYLMAKPAGSACNMRCSYCYYLEKGDATKPQLMDSCTLREFIRQYIAMSTTPEVVFTWHGGEPMLRQLDFYKEAMRLQRHYGQGRPILNCLQTNGMLMTEEWARWLAHEQWLVGVSIDGPEWMHNSHRIDARGRQTHQRVMRSISMMRRYGVEWNAMATVNSVNAEHPEEFYDFFRSIGCRYLQFTPIVERRTDNQHGHLASISTDTLSAVTAESVTPQQWGDFLCGVYDRWILSDVGNVFVQIFDATLAGWVGQTPGVCTMAQYCGHAGVIEHDGTVYTCDHFVFPEYRLGNIHDSSLVEMTLSERAQGFRRLKRNSLPQVCLDCRYSMVCNGECPKNRFIESPAPGVPGKNYLCDGYRRFFEHVSPTMDFMARCLRSELPPSLVMSEFDKSKG